MDIVEFKDSAGSFFSLSCKSHWDGSVVWSRICWVLFAPCPQYWLLSAVQSAFLIVFLVLFIQRFVVRLGEAGRQSKAPSSDGALFRFTVLLSVLGTLIYLGLEVWNVCTRTTSGKNQARPTGDLFFTTFQVVKFFVFLTIIAHEKRSGASVHPRHLRAWWYVDAVSSSLLAASAVFRISQRPEAARYSVQLRVNDIVNLVILPVSVFFLVLAIRGKTGISRNPAHANGLSKPLIEARTNGAAAEEAGPATGYADAGFLSKATWLWLAPLLKRGYKAALQLDDIPQLSSKDRVEHNYALFQNEWNGSVRRTLLKCFGGKVFSNGVLALVRLCVMYTGPIMIQRFVNYTSSSNRSVSQGYYLVLILLAAKCLEVLSSHQYNFQSQRLGMVVRSTVMAGVYQKGLRLSSSSKQGHGVGEIVNYMVVDAQQLSDLMFLLHNIWILPGQVCIALAILYSVIGLPMLAGFAVMIIATAFNFYSTRQQRRCQNLLMKARDERMKATNEVLNFMKIIKFQAWEEHFLKRVEAFRNREYGSLSKFMYALCMNITVLWVCPSLVATVTFGACVLFKVGLTAGKVFTATATFRILQEPIRAFPQTLISISQALVSLERLDKYMLSEELDPEAVEHVSSLDSAVKVCQASFTWDEMESRPTLENIDFDIKKGQFVTIVGTVGSGKSSLLAALLGEMQKLHGTVKLCGSTAYVPQTAWIQNATVEDNILFGQPMDRERYRSVIKSCALEQDLRIMDHGDQTEIGERGINVSGGQKQRIQLARAVYQDSDVYLLDDVFSAVDAHTGTQLFKDCVRGVLKGKTVLLVTHQVEFLHAADLILVMREGAIVQSGKYYDLLQQGTDLKALVLAHQSAMEAIGVPEQQGDSQMNLEKEVLLENSIEAGSIAGTCSPHPANLQRIESQTRSSSFQRRSSHSSLEVQPKSRGSSKLIDEEQRESGHVGWSVYKLYWTKAFGWWAPGFLVLGQACWTAVNTSSDYWLANQTSKKSNFNPRLFIGVYFILSAVSWMLVACRTIITVVAGLKTAQAFYFDMLRNIFRTPMSFFDTTPSGRILSRASTDQTQLDVLLPYFSSGSVATFLGTLGILVVTCQITWPILFLIIPLGWVFLSYQGYFIATSRELTRLDSITKAPVIFHFSETLAGILTIRAFKKQKQFADMNISRVNTNIQMDFHNNAANEWLGFRLEMIGTTVLCFSTLLLISLPSNLIKSSLVGLSLSYGLALNSALFWSVWLACMVENKMVSVERIRQYTVIESEAPRINEAFRPPPDWPSEGTIVMNNLQLRYRPNTPLVLKGLTLTIQGGHKVGVVGRTGSGKSTLIQAFFRLVEPCGGRITIDDVDITKLGLADLRSKFGIIPQEPILFEGSVRSNVDPLGQYSDSRIWEVLEKCQLADVVRQKAGELDSAVLDSGENWSVGQKQLFCLGRALLKDSRVLFLDEATASVDAQTDLIIQKTIKEQFAKSTVISVAHRIPSVMDSDKVLVMAEGQVKEYSEPSVLLEQPSSLFAGLVREYAARSESSANM